MEEPSEILKMILEVTVFAVGIYLVLRFLRETRGSGVLRGLLLILIGGFVCFAVLIDFFELDRLALLFSALMNIAIVGLIIVFHPEIRPSISFCRSMIGTRWTVVGSCMSALMKRGNKISMESISPAIKASIMKSAAGRTSENSGVSLT